MPDSVTNPDEPSTATAPRSADGAASTEKRGSGIDGLKRMSTTAGLGSGDYAAVNTLAVVALGVSLAGLLAFVTELLLLLPLAAVVLALIAWTQIRRSGGTQTGRPLAATAIAISLLIGGYVVARGFVERSQRDRDMQAVVVGLKEFSDAVGSGNYDRAYELTTPQFKQNVSLEKFKDPLLAFEAMKDYNGVSAIEWNNTGMLFATSAGDFRTATLGVRFRYKNPNAEPTSVNLTMSPVDGGAWRINSIPPLYEQ